MQATPRYTASLTPTGEATALLTEATGTVPAVPVVATAPLRERFDAICLDQALATRAAPGVSALVLNPDAHAGYGAPIGCALASETHVYPGPVGVDIKCSMSLLQTDVPEDAIADRKVRRALIDAILARTPTGAGKDQRSVRKSRRVAESDGWKAVVEGASVEVCEALGIPPEWAARCEDSFHVGHDGTAGALAEHLQRLMAGGVVTNLPDKIRQLGSYGGGNHFGEAEVVRVRDAQQATADVFGLKDGHVAFLSHCGSRGFGYALANNAFKRLQAHFQKTGTPYPAGDRELVYAELGTAEADHYLDSMALGGNFATVNHLLINALVLEAFQEVLPGTTGRLVYFISHNIAREETTDEGRTAWVHRKGATRAFPAGHASLAATPFAETGHPILLPGNPHAGSSVMVASAGAAANLYSVNHGAGRALGRKAAFRTLDQASTDAMLADADILTNCRTYPLDEAPGAYKDFREVLRAVETADLATEVARLDARFVIKDQDKSLRGAA